MSSDRAAPRPGARVPGNGLFCGTAAFDVRVAETPIVDEPSFAAASTCRRQRAAPAARGPGIDHGHRCRAGRPHAVRRAGRRATRAGNRSALVSAGPVQFPARSRRRRRLTSRAATATGHRCDHHHRSDATRRRRPTRRTDPTDTVRGQRRRRRPPATATHVRAATVDSAPPPARPCTSRRRLVDDHGARRPRRHDDPPSATPSRPTSAADLDRDASSADGQRLQRRAADRADGAWWLLLAPCPVATDATSPIGWRDVCLLERGGVCRLAWAIGRAAIDATPCTRAAAVPRSVATAPAAGALRAPRPPAPALLDAAQDDAERARTVMRSVGERRFLAGRGDVARAAAAAVSTTRSQRAPGGGAGSSKTRSSLPGVGGEVDVAVGLGRVLAGQVHGERARLARPSRARRAGRRASVTSGRPSGPRGCAGEKVALAQHRMRAAKGDQRLGEAEQVAIASRAASSRPS